MCGRIMPPRTWTSIPCGRASRCCHPPWIRCATMSRFCRTPPMGGCREGDGDPRDRPAVVAGRLHDATAATGAGTPPTLRTVKALFVWAGKIEVARQHSEAARRECAGRLDALNSWVLEHVK